MCANKCDQNTKHYDGPMLNEVPQEVEQAAQAQEAQVALAREALGTRVRVRWGLTGLVLLVLLVPRYPLDLDHPQTSLVTVKEEGYGISRLGFYGITRLGFYGITRLGFGRIRGWRALMYAG